MPNHNVINSAQACYDPMIKFIKKNLSRIYIALFTGLAIELLALCNVITHLCTMDNYQRRKWEVSPEEQRKYIHQSNHNLSDDTLVPSTITESTKPTRQF